MRVALFVTCLVDTLMPAAGRATVEVLERLGHEVSFPRDQTCCGQMHANTGYPDEAVRVARRFAAVFGPSPDVVVCPSGSCVAMIREHYPRLAESAGDPALAAELTAIGERTFELTEFLVRRLGVEDVGARFAGRVTLHPACHSLRSLRIGDAPERLLRAVEGLELVPLPDAEVCCGFGGTFAVKNAPISGAMLADKVAAIERTDADWCVAVDASCLLHIGGGLRRAAVRPRTLHVAEVLAGR